MEKPFFAYCMFFLFRVWVGEGEGKGGRDCGSSGTKPPSVICNFPFVYPFSENRCFVDSVIVYHMKRQIEGSDFKIFSWFLLSSISRMSCLVSSCLSVDLIKMDCACYSVSLQFPALL